MYRSVFQKNGETDICVDQFPETRFSIDQFPGKLIYTEIGGMPNYMQITMYFVLVCIVFCTINQTYCVYFN